jgi:hypothetical protein
MFIMPWQLKYGRKTLVAGEGEYGIGIAHRRLNYSRGSLLKTSYSPGIISTSVGGKVRDCVFYAEVMENRFIIFLSNALSLVSVWKKNLNFYNWVEGGREPLS